MATNCKLNDYNYSGIGFNLRITNLHASIALAQLTRFKQIYNRKIKITQIYEKKLKKFQFLPKNSWCKNVLWFNAIILKKGLPLLKVVKYMNKKKVRCSNFWKPLHLQDFYKKFKKEKLELKNKIWNKILVLPSSSNIKLDDVIKITKIINTIK